MDYSGPQFTSPGERASVYRFSEGLPETVFGIAMLLMGTTGLLWRVYLPYAWMEVLFLVACLSVFILIIFGGKSWIG